MYDSCVTAKTLIDNLIDEADVAFPIPLETWLLWLNQLEYMLYSEIVQEQGKVWAQHNELREIYTPELNNPDDEARILAEDILFVYADGVQLMKSSPASGVIFPDTWYINGRTISYNTVYEPEEIILIYKVRPRDKAAENYDARNVMVPYGFIDMVKSKLRGEAYKIANEDLLAAKWINDYNVLLENFKLFVQNRQPQFGI